MLRHTHPWKRQDWSGWWRWGYFSVTINSAWEAILYKKPSTETGKTDSYHSMWVLIFPNSSLSAYFWKFVKIFVKIINQIEGKFLEEQYIWHSFTRQMFMPVAMLFHIQYSIICSEVFLTLIINQLIRNIVNCNRVRNTLCTNWCRCYV